MKTLNWALIGSDVAAALTAISLIPYDKDTMQIVNQVVPGSWIPYIIKAGIASTLLLRLLGRYTSKPAQSAPQPEPPKP